MPGQGLNFLKGGTNSLYKTDRRHLSLRSVSSIILSALLIIFPSPFYRRPSRPRMHLLLRSFFLQWLPSPFPCLLPQYLLLIHKPHSIHRPVLPFVPLISFLSLLRMMGHIAGQARLQSAHREGTQTSHLRYCCYFPTSLSPSFLLKCFKPNSMPAMILVSVITGPFSWVTTISKRCNAFRPTSANLFIISLTSSALELAFFISEFAFSRVSFPFCDKSSTAFAVLRS